MVERYDHVKPRRDLERWLDYVGMTEEEFDAIADTFRDPRVWAQGRGRELGQGLDPRVRRAPRRGAAMTCAAPARDRHPAGRADGRAGAALRGRRRVAARAPRPLRRGAAARPARRPSTRAAVGKYGLDYRRCARCGTVYMSPRPSPDLLDEYYRTSRTTSTGTRSSSRRPRRRAASRSSARAPSAWSSCARTTRGRARWSTSAPASARSARRWRARRLRARVALEPEPHLAADLPRQGPRGDRGAGRARAAGRRGADVVTSFEVIEHLFSPRELRRALRDVSARPAACWSSPARTCAGFDVEMLGERSATVDAEHLNYFHPASLGALLERCGFEVLEAQTPGRLDAELVRKKAAGNELELAGQPFLRRVLSTSGSGSASRSRTSWPRTGCRRTCGWQGGRADAAPGLGEAAPLRAAAGRSR